VLLIALWVRSYSVWNSVIGQNGLGVRYTIVSCRGNIGFGWFPFRDPFGRPLSNLDFPDGWDSGQMDSLGGERPIQHAQMVCVPRTRSPAGRTWWITIDPTILISYGHVAFLFAVIGTVVALPWISWPNRFTLRTLLIATTLVAMVLGLVVWSVR
jgi:hypothetical protein